jgi:magnesium-protoporphyrin O-methyltransferase
MADPEPPPSCCFDEWAEHNAKRARSKETVAPITSALLAALEAEGLEGRTILDVGCGTGDLALAAVAHGATAANGFDLGTGAIEHARRLARERGLQDRAVFEVADGSVVPLPAADVVVLNRVVCCYADARGLLANTLGAARSVYAITAPVDRGFPGIYNRIVVRVSNVWYAIRRSKFRGFRVFVHDLAGVDARIHAAGFALVRRERRRVVWELAVYSRG